MRTNLLRVVEELLILYKPYLSKIELELEIAHSEKTNQLSLICQTKGKKFNPLDNKDLEERKGRSLAIMKEYDNCHKSILGSSVYKNRSNCEAEIDDLIAYVFDGGR